MKVIERLALIDKIATELQSRMTFRDIDVYLIGHGINPKAITESFTSKYVYVKAVLAKEPEDAVLRISDELEIEHGFAVATKKESTVWKAGHFRLFLSHISAFKKQTSTLQTVLKKYGISSFVAHEDIEPSKEWLGEIESSLFTMDALAALLMPGFKESSWCDQEVGVAFGREVLIIPVIRGLLPYGFFGKYQGIHAEGKTIGQVAEEIFQALVRNPKTRQKSITCLVTLLGQSTAIPEAHERLDILGTIPSIPVTSLESLKQMVSENGVLSGDKEFVGKLNPLLKTHGVTELSVGIVLAAADFDDDIPF